MEELVITKSLKAGRQQVFDAWSKPENIAQWWGPVGFDTSVKTFNFQPGGVFHYSFAQGNSAAMWGKFVFSDITAPETIHFVNAFSDADGNITRAPFDDVWPLEIFNAVTLAEEEGETTLTLRARPVNASPEEQQTFVNNLDNMRLGYGGTFNRLETFLAP